MVLKVQRARFLVAVLVAAVALLVNAPRSVAQTVAGRIVGTIRDSQAAVIPNASVSAKNLETGAERTTLSDASGGFNITSIPAGSYEVTASAPGFQKEVRSGVTLTVGAALRVDFTLNVGGLQEQLVVTGEAPQGDPTNSTMAGQAGRANRPPRPPKGTECVRTGGVLSRGLPGQGRQPAPGGNVTPG